MPKTPEKVARRSRRRRVLVLGLGLFLCGWLVWSFKTFALPTRLYMIPTGSMAPTLRAGDRIGVAENSWSQPRRGEIWVFQMPLPSGQKPNKAVKRIIGLPGETVEVANGRVLIDGQPLAEPYLTTTMSYALPAVSLGRDEYFVLGDNRNGSHDSHVWGALPADHLIGPVKMRVWPVGRIGGF